MVFTRSGLENKIYTHLTPYLVLNGGQYINQLLSRPES